jgi:hypothetical protein
MAETEIIKLVFGLFLGVGGGVLLLLAFTVGYRYLVMEQRCTCRTIERISEPYIVWGTVFVQTKRHSLP